MSDDFEVCVIGSGAGGGPIAATLAAAGHSVVVLEKGPWLTDRDLFKDELAASRRGVYASNRLDEPQVVETFGEDGWSARPTTGTAWDFWNGNMLGGASNLMSGFFHRLKPDDFRLLSKFGPVAGANVADWPITYDDLEPWYARVEREIGVSGQVQPHPLADRRSTGDFPFPPLAEHPVAGWLDRTCKDLGLHCVRVPRAVLSIGYNQRGSCSYTGFCAEYGCATGAKGSSRVALLNAAVATGKCELRCKCMAHRLTTDTTGRITGAEYHDGEGELRRVTARIYVVACQAIETARLLLLSAGPRHPHGLANQNGLVGRNLLFSTAAWARATLSLDKFDAAAKAELASAAPWLNRSVQDFYSFVDPALDPAPGHTVKGGTLEFMLSHPNPIGQAVSTAFSGDNGPLWGLALKRKLETAFRRERHVVVEVFADWLPTPGGRVTLDPELKDKWGHPVARVRIDKHPRNKRVADFLLGKGVEVLRSLGGEAIVQSSRGAPSTNLIGGTCRFGHDPNTSVLDANCRAHDVDNLYVSDASFMPTGGSVPFTWTVYANAFRVAAAIRAQLAR